MVEGGALSLWAVLNWGARYMEQSLTFFSLVERSGVSFRMMVRWRCASRRAVLQKWSKDVYLEWQDLHTATLTRRSNRFKIQSRERRS